MEGSMTLTAFEQLLFPLLRSPTANKKKALSALSGLYCRLHFHIFGRESNYLDAATFPFRKAELMVWKREPEGAYERNSER
jgi:hypothetical protein